MSTAYLRPNWVLETPFYEKYARRAERQLDNLWKPTSKLFLSQAIDRYGSLGVTGWNWTEIGARQGLSAPERPWLKYASKEHHPNCLIFDATGNPNYVEEHEAEAWWLGVEEQLKTEWREEIEAFHRRCQAIDGLRNFLAEGKLRSVVMQDSGLAYPVPAEFWCSRAAASAFGNYYAEVHVMSGYSSTKISGPVLIEKEALDKLFRSDTGEEAAKHNAGVRHGPEQGQNIVYVTEDHPYLAYMVKAIREIPFPRNSRIPKKEIEAWLRENWPQRLGSLTPNKISSMATFLRRPEDEAGGIVGLSRPSNASRTKKSQSK